MIYIGKDEIEIYDYKNSRGVRVYNIGDDYWMTRRLGPEGHSDEEGLTYTGVTPKELLDVLTRYVGDKHGLTKRVQELLIANKKVEAIKEVRRVKGWDLKRSKVYVEREQADLKEEGRL